MLLVADSNVLFTFFWGGSVFRKLSLKQDLRLFSPELALSEIARYSSEIIDKTGISKEEFCKLRKELIIGVNFVPSEEYSLFLKQSASLAEDLSEEDKIEFLNDIDFFALALKLNCPLWSNDALLKKQSKVTVFTTKELIHIISDLE